MKSLLLLAFLLPFCLQAGDLTGRKAAIELKDKTRLVGTVTEAKDGTYTVATKSLGDVTVHESHIASISFDQDAVQEAKQKVASGRTKLPNISQDKLQAMTGRNTPAVETMASQILNDPSLMGLVVELMEDPEMQRLLNDPELMKAAEEGDLGVLLDSGLIQKLMQNQKVHSIAREVVDGQATTPGATKGGQE